MKTLYLEMGQRSLFILYARSLRPEKVLIVEPTFNEYSKAFKVAGSNIYNYYTDEEENFKIQVEKLISKIDDINPNVLVICNPNNLTGVLYNTDKLLPILHKLNEINAYLFVDEVFYRFC